ncbi:MAG TPA: hypothetical protein VEL74_11585 [Thermoanaerobaculia bacterium]|nr:hypothetical protein [Thermoanaerobaculia bacterium]
MRKKLIKLTLALTVLAAASLMPAPAAEAACNTYCCPDGRCVTCCRPCAIRCAP